MVEVGPEDGLIGGLGVLAYKVLGPAAGELGETLRLYTVYRTNNVRRVLEKADQRSDEPQPDDSAVHPRVAHRLMEEGSWIDDDVMQGYLGGLLSASRIAGGSEERGAYYLNIVSSLTSSQIKMHHAIYSAIAARRLEVHYGSQGGLQEVSVVASVSDVVDFLPGEGEPVQEVGEILTALHRERLIDAYLTGDDAGLKENDPVLEVREISFVARPTAIGMLLYLWGVAGVRTSDPNAILTLPEGDPVGGPRLPRAALHADFLYELRMRSRDPNLPPESIPGRPYGP